MSNFVVLRFTKRLQRLVRRRRAAAGWTTSSPALTVAPRASLLGYHLGVEAHALAPELSAWEVAAYRTMFERATFDSGGRLRRDELSASRVKVPPMAAPELSFCAFSGRSWWLRAAQHSQVGHRPVGSQPRPPLLERAVSKVADFAAFDHVGRPSSRTLACARGCGVPTAAPSLRSSS